LNSTSAPGLHWLYNNLHGKRKNTETLSVASKKIGLEINIEKTKSRSYLEISIKTNSQHKVG